MSWYIQYTICNFNTHVLPIVVFVAKSVPLPCYLEPSVVYTSLASCRGSLTDILPHLIVKAAHRKESFSSCSSYFLVNTRIVPAFVGIFGGALQFTSIGLNSRYTRSTIKWKKFPRMSMLASIPLTMISCFVYQVVHSFMESSCTWRRAGFRQRCLPTTIGEFYMPFYTTCWYHWSKWGATKSTYYIDPQGLR